VSLAGICDDVVGVQANGVAPSENSDCPPPRQFFATLAAKDMTETL
jgi:hypothetical protein